MNLPDHRKIMNARTHAAVYRPVQAAYAIEVGPRPIRFYIWRVLGAAWRVLRWRAP
jgi:hypothetical protein